MLFRSCVRERERERESGRERGGERVRKVPCSGPFGPGANSVEYYTAQHFLKQSGTQCAQANCHLLIPHVIAAPSVAQRGECGVCARALYTLASQGFVAHVSFFFLPVLPLDLEFQCLLELHACTK